MQPDDVSAVFAGDGRSRVEDRPAGFGLSEDGGNGLDRHRFLLNLARFR